MRPFRKERVASLVRGIVGEALLHRLQDPRIASFTSVTRVEVTADFQIAKVYLSVPGGEAVERRTLSAVRHARGFLQRMVADELTLRQCPELRFEVDEAAKIALTTLTLIEQNRRALEETQGGAPDGTEGAPPSIADGPDLGVEDPMEPDA